MDLTPLRKATEEASLRIEREESLGHKAAAAVLPGPLKEAFALNQSVAIGKWSVRPFYDIDFEFLDALGHPLARMYADGLSGEATKATFLPTGQPMWQAAWVMTRSVDEVEDLLMGEDGVEVLKRKARAEFGRQPTRVLGDLFKAIMDQIEASSKTTVQFEAVETEREEANAPSNPSSLHRLRTG